MSTSSVSPLALPRLIQAPMAGATDAGFVIAACRSGLLGSLGGGGLQPASLAQAIRAIRGGTDAPFNINLFVIDEHLGQRPAGDELAALEAYCAELGLALELPSSYAPSFPEQLQVLLDEAPPVASFTFGLLAADQVAALQQRGCRVIGTATTVDEAKAWTQVGADAICLQGIEAGGHRGPFLSEHPGIPLEALFRSCLESIGRPLIVAGGIMNGQQAASYLAAGAIAAQLGSAFLCCPESPAPAGYKRALLAARSALGDQTTLIKSFSGRQARGLPNTFTRHFETLPISPYPIRNALTQPLRRWAAQHGDSENLSLWVGQGHRAIRPLPLAELAAQLWDELATALQSTSI